MIFYAYSIVFWLLRKNDWSAGRPACLEREGAIVRLIKLFTPLISNVCKRDAQRSSLGRRTIEKHFRE
jgi:hypothetical protein